MIMYSITWFLSLSYLNFYQCYVKDLSLHFLVTDTSAVHLLFVNMKGFFYLFKVVDSLLTFHPIIESNIRKK